MIFNLLTPQGVVSLTDYVDKSIDDSVSGDEHDGRFPLGGLVVTANARDVLADVDIKAALARHKSCDWGDVCEEDRQSNEDALMYGNRILSAYTGSCGNRFWIITEADRSATTVLLPEDY
jgi:hypothetical protein